MGVVHQMLKPDGLFLLHTIGNCEHSTVVDPWIEKYIFRNSMAPAMSQLADAAEGRFVVEDWENYGHYYVADAPGLVRPVQRELGPDPLAEDAAALRRAVPPPVELLPDVVEGSLRRRAAAPVADRDDAPQFRPRRLPARDAHVAAIPAAAAAQDAA